MTHVSNLLSNVIHFARLVWISVSTADTVWSCVKQFDGRVGRHKQIVRRIDNHLLIDYFVQMSSNVACSGLVAVVAYVQTFTFGCVRKTHTVCLFVIQTTTGRFFTAALIVAAIANHIHGRCRCDRCSSVGQIWLRTFSERCTVQQHCLLSLQNGWRLQSACRGIYYVICWSTVTLSMITRAVTCTATVTDRQNA